MIYNTKKNYKLLPCIVLIQTGSCPYRERCQFKHPEGLKGKTSSKTRLKNHEDDTKDLFYYPPIVDGKTENYKIMDTIDLNRLPIFEHLGKGKCIDIYKTPNLSFIESRRFTLSERDVRTSNMINSLIKFIDNNKKLEKGKNHKNFLKEKEVYCSFCKYKKNNYIRQNTNSPKCVTDIY